MAKSGRPETSRVFSLIRRGEAQTRADLQQELGLSRVTLSKRLSDLLDTGLVEEAGQFDSTGGRPRTVFKVRSTFGLLLAADIDTSVSRVAVTDFAGTLLADSSRASDITDGPTSIMGWVQTQFEQLLESLHRTPKDVVGIGLSVPGPVEPDSGRIIHPPTMPGWHGVRPADLLGPSFHHPPVATDRNASALALYEGRYGLAQHGGLIVVRLGDGISSAVIENGELVQGTSGMAGDMGHLRIPEGQQCRCGHFGCLESVAGGWALKESMSRNGWTVDTCEDLAALAARGDSLSIDLLAGAGRLIGRQLAPVVCALSPARVIIGGPLSEAGGLLIRPLREALQAVIPTHLLDKLHVTGSTAARDAGIVGSALLGQRLATDAVHIGATMKHRSASKATSTAQGATPVGGLDLPVQQRPRGR